MTQEQAFAFVLAVLANPIGQSMYQGSEVELFRKQSIDDIRRMLAVFCDVNLVDRRGPAQ